jgi:hypothetical protein
LLSLTALVVVVVAHAAVGGVALVYAGEGLAVVMFSLAVGSALLGVAHSWRRYPQHRKAIAFVVIITLATLLAHAYVIGSPSASAPGSVGGAPSSTFSDSRVSVTSVLTGQQLLLTVEASGSDAISQVNVSDNIGALPGQGLYPAPSYSSPLQPGTSTVGNWTVPSGENVTQVTVSYQYLSCYDSKDLVYGCIMDEVYYVPAAQHMLSGAQCQMDAPRNSPGYCNPEHPPLTKALVAAGMAVFGEYNVVGWRVMPALLGTFTIPLLFGIAWKVSGSKKLAGLSALLLSLDVMFFSQSSGALLDIPALFFSVAAFFAYFVDLKWWKFDRYVFAGVLLGAAGLSKETSVFSAMALITYVFFFGDGPRLTRLYHMLKVMLVVGIVFAGGLQVYDSTLASAAAPTFVSQVSYMLSYGSSLIAHQLACQPTTGYWCKYPSQPGGPPILPTDWLVYYSPVAYYLVSVSTSAGLNYVAVGYYGITNLLETWTTFIWIPLVAYALYDYRRMTRAPKLAPQPEPTAMGAQDQPIASTDVPPGGMSGELKFAGLALIMFFWAYVPYLFLLLGSRVTYPFYFVDAVPAVAMGASYWMNKRWFPKPLLAVYLGATFVFFLAYFPDKSFLPIWLRALLRH